MCVPHTPQPQDSMRDVLTEREEVSHDVRARWAASAARVASQAYSAAYGREIVDDATRVRWRIEPRVAVTAAFVLTLVGLGVWWNTSSAPTLPEYVGASGEPSPVATALSVAGTSGVGHPDSPAKTSAETSLVIHVSGAVVRPGLVTVADGARVADAVEGAGGIEGEADLSAVNLARLARDGEHVHVPAIGEAQPDAGGSAPAPGPVDLNHASATQLQTLPGIGPVLAQRIVDDRDANGPFSSVSDLTRVSGVGDALASGIADLAVT